MQNTQDYPRSLLRATLKHENKAVIQCDMYPDTENTWFYCDKNIGKNNFVSSYDEETEELIWD